MRSYNQRCESGVVQAGMKYLIWFLYGMLPPRTLKDLFLHPGNIIVWQRQNMRTKEKAHGDVPGKVSTVCWFESTGTHPSVAQSPQAWSILLSAIPLEGNLAGRDVLSSGKQNPCEAKVMRQGWRGGCGDMPRVGKLSLMLIFLEIHHFCSSLIPYTIICIERLPWTRRVDLSSFTSWHNVSITGARMLEDDKVMAKMTQEGGWAWKYPGMVCPSIHPTTSRCIDTSIAQSYATSMVSPPFRGVGA